MPFRNKTVVITGGAKGIGAGCASVFYRDQANVAVVDRDSAAGNEFAEKLGKRALFVECDISEEREVQQAVEKISGTFGSIDILVNNAGILKYFSVTETSEEDWNHVLNVNLKGAFLCAKYCIPKMQEAGEGVVVNMSSVQAFVAQRNVAAYIASKSALVGLTRSIAVDYAPKIRSVAICPGGVDTPMNRAAFRQSADPVRVRRDTENLHLNGRMATPGEIGELVAFVCSEKGTFMNGQPIRIDGGLGIHIAGSKTDK